MKIFVKLVVFTLYIGVFSISFMGLSCCFGQEIDTTALKKKALLGQNQLVNSMQKITATGTIKHGGLTGGKPMRVVYHVDGDRRCIEFYNDDRQDSKDGGYGRIYVFTPSYQFELTQASSDAAYVVVSAGDTIPEAAKPRVRHFKRMAADNFLFAPSLIAGYDPRDVLAENGWQILDVSSVTEQSAGDLLYRIHAELVNPENNLQRFVFTLSPNQSWGVSSYEAVYGNPNTEIHSGEITYLNEKINGMPLFEVNRKMIQTSNGITRTFPESVVFDSIQQGCRDEVFLLGHYLDAKDPFARPRKIWPFWVLIGLGIVAALGCYRLWVNDKTN